MVDIDLLKDRLRLRGHSVEHVIKTPANAGEYEFIVDGETLTLEETRALLAEDQANAPGGPLRTVEPTQESVNDPTDDRPHD